MKYNTIFRCDWEITSKCNLSCKHCLIDYFPKKELSEKECLIVLKNLKKEGCMEINFTGGEPLTKKGIFNILKRSYFLGIKNYLFTNGTLITKKNILQIKKYVSYVGISLEGLKGENDFIRGKNCFDLIENALYLLNKEKIQFGVYITLNKLNINQIEDILKFLKKFHPRNISINQLVFRGRAKKNKKILQTAIPKKKIIMLIKKYSKINTLNKEENCWIKKNSIFLNSEGKVYACSEIMQNNPKNNLGTIIPLRLGDYYNFIQKLKDKKNICPYTYLSNKKINLNLLNDNSCPYL